MLTFKVKAIKLLDGKPHMGYAIEEEFFAKEYEKEATDYFKFLMDTMPTRRDLISGDYLLTMRYCLIKESGAQSDDDCAIRSFPFTVKNNET